MSYVRGMLIVGFVAAVVLGVTVLDASAAARCGGQHKLRVLDLDMTPDPIAAGQPIQAWRVRIEGDRSGECDTILEVRESPGTDVVGLELRQVIRPGVQDITFRAVQGYRFQPREHCFAVIADIAGTRRPIDAAKRFCARYIPPAGPAHWTLKERGDAPVKAR